MSPDSWTTGGRGDGAEGEREVATRGCVEEIRGGWRGDGDCSSVRARKAALWYYLRANSQSEKNLHRFRGDNAALCHGPGPRSFASQRADDVYGFFNRVTYFTHCPRWIIPTYKREKIFFIVFVGQISQNDMLQIQAQRLLKINRNLNKVHFNNNFHSRKFHTLVTIYCVL